MITGAHFLIHSKDPDADRIFFQDILGFRAVDAGGGWLIFALPSAEIAVHPSSENFVHGHAEDGLFGAVLYLMCNELHSFVESLQNKGVTLSEIQEENWGLVTSMTLPSGGRIGLYQPSHVTALDLD